MSHCKHPNCSTPRIKALNKAHSFLCNKSKHYHAWHHNPHHRKVHYGTLAVCAITLLALLISNNPQPGKAAESFRATFDSGSLNADYSVGVGTASNDGTPAAITSPGYNDSSGAVTLTAGQTLKYPVANNLDNAKGEIEMKFQLPYDLKGDQGKGGMDAPYGISYDSASGYFYVADATFNRVIKTKFDGTDWTEYGVWGANAGQFKTPKGLYFDAASEFMYIADSANNRIVKTKIDGTGWTSLGGPTSGSGTGQFNNPYGIWYDVASEFIYVADSNNNRIVKTKINGAEWTTYGGTAAGSGVGQFSNPCSITFDAASGNAYVADTNNDRAIKTALDGTWADWTVITGLTRIRDIKYDAPNDFIYLSYFNNTWDTGYIVKTKIDGTLRTNLSLGGYSTPKGLFYDSGTGDIYTARGQSDSSPRLFRTKIDGTNQLSYGMWGKDNGRFYYPAGVHFDKDSGRLFIVDRYTQRITVTKWDYSGYSSLRPYTGGMSGNIVYDPSSDFIYASNGDCVAGLFKVKPDGSNLTALTPTDGCNRTTGVYYDSLNSHVYRTRRSANQVIRTSPSATSPVTLAGFNNPTGVWGDPATGFIYVTDTSNHRIVRTKIDGSEWTTFGANGNGVNQFSSPTGIFYDPIDDYMYIADSGNNRIVKTKMGGADWTTLGGPTSGSGVNQFNSPQYLSVNTDTGDIYVTDQYNARVIRTKIDGAGWDTINGDPTKTLLKTSGSFPMTLKLSALSGKLSFFPSEGTLAYNLQTAAISNLSAGTWHTVKVAYNNSSGTVSTFLDGSQIATQTFPPWAPPDIGSNFYIGTDPSVGYSYRALSAPIDEIKLTSIASDSQAPVNPSGISVYNAPGGTLVGSNADSGKWFKYGTPSFSWPVLGEANAATDEDSGVQGYFVYFGTNSEAIPETDGAFQTGTTFNPTDLQVGETYYLKIKTRDYAYNLPDTWEAFTYKYENIIPSNSAFVAVSPSTYTPNNSYNFYWQDVRNDTGGSGFDKFRYKINNGSWVDIDHEEACTGGQCQLALSDVANDGLNIFHLEAIDLAGNESSEVSTNFYYALNASGVRNLAADPLTSEGAPAPLNNFSFTWDEPLNYSGEITKYHYSVNNYPTEYNTLTATSRALPTDHYATKQGENILYVIAEDETGVNFNACLQITGNPDSDRCASIKFYTQTSAPSVPLAFQLRDTSVRDLHEYSVNLRWATPEETGAGFAGFEIYRAEGQLNDDGSLNPNSCGAFESTATTIKKAYADTDLESIQYCFYVKAKDNAGQYSIPTNTLYVKPTGDYTSPPSLRPESVQVTARATSVIIAWTTEDIRDSFHKANTIVKYGKDRNNLDKEISSATAYTNDHAIAIYGLEPETTYFYKLVWQDINGNTGESDIFQLLTNAKPTIANVKVANIALKTATVTLDSTTEANLSLSYSTNQSDFSMSKPLIETAGSYGTSHVFNLNGLNHSTPYFFRITGYDKSNDPITSDTYPFETLTMPNITAKGVQMDQDESSPTTAYRFSWETNIPTTSVIYYQDNKGKRLSQSNAEYVTQHELKIANLSDMSTYSFEVLGTDNYGNVVEVPFKADVTTPLDSREPVVSNMTVEIKSSGFGASQKAQIVITWETDEPATSQIEYSQGISGSEYSFKSKEDTALSTSHAVIVSELEPSKIYHLRAVSRDGAGNSGYSEDTTTITGKTQQSIMDIIMSSLERSLGWMFKIFN